MIIAFICPDSYNNYAAIELELEKHEGISKILCATTNSCTLSKRYADKNNIEHYRETCSGKEEALRRVVKSADKVIAFQQKERDLKKYSRTQIALNFAEKFNKDVQLNFI